MNTTIFSKIQTKGIIEFCVASTFFAIAYMRSYVRNMCLRVRGYAVALSVVHKGRSAFSQSEIGSIHIGKHTILGNNVRLDAGFSGKIHIADSVLIDDNCFITAQKNISIGNHVMIAANCFITDFNHEFRSKRTHIDQQGFVRDSVVIEDDVWIGAHVCILKGVRIGRGSVIGAGSVVTHNIKPYEVVAGNPAKHIRYRT